MSAVEQDLHDDDSITLAQHAIGQALTDLHRETLTLSDSDPQQVADCARALCILRDLKADAATVFADVEQHLLGMMGDRRLEVPGLGVFESHRRTKRTGWDHDALVRAVVRTVPEEAVGNAYMVDPIDVAAALRECISFGAGKVTGLRARGLEPDEYCKETPDGWSLQLPPRDHDKDVA